jgi:predicted amidophosphoribosyltransferase
MKVPLCPNCGAKFAHDNTLLCCKRCGLPDEVAIMGSLEIARWRRKPTGTVDVGRVAVPGQRLDSLSKRARKLKRRRHAARRWPNKHGRVGVRDARFAQGSSPSRGR